MFYAANPGFSHPKQVIYSLTIKVQDMCGENTEVLTVEIDAVTPPKINQNTASVTIYEEQVRLNCYIFSENVRLYRLSNKLE